VPFEKLQELFLSFFENETGYDAIDNVRRRCNDIVDDNQKVQFLRAKLINLLVQRATAIFMQQEEALLSGTLEAPLIDLLPAHKKQLVKDIDKYSVEHIYNHRSVVEIEIAGYQVIGALLQEFVSAVIDPQGGRSKKLVQLIPAQFPIDVDASLYSNLESIVDFVAGMTDLYAVEMYRKITGIEFAQIG
jgi:dGTPase